MVTLKCTVILIISYIKIRSSPPETLFTSNKFLPYDNNINGTLLFHDQECPFFDIYCDKNYLSIYCQIIHVN